MAVKYLCDLCGGECKPGSMSGELSALSRDAFGKNKGQPILTKYLICEECLREVRGFVSELITKKHNEKNL